MAENTPSTRFLDVQGGRIAYDVAVMDPSWPVAGHGRTRATYRSLAQLLAGAGHGWRPWTSADKWRQ